MLTVDSLKVPPTQLGVGPCQPGPFLASERLKRLLLSSLLPVSPLLSVAPVHLVTVRPTPLRAAHLPPPAAAENPLRAQFRLILPSLVPAVVLKLPSRTLQPVHGVLLHRPEPKFQDRNLN